VQRAVRVCETGMLTFPTVAQLAKRLGVSQNTLLNACRRELRMSAVELIVRIKLQKAKELLRTTDHKLLHIAQACGFHSLSHFIHSFRQAERRTPGEWRQKARAGRENSKRS
jgi:AraC family transcriptional regulator